MKTIRYNQWSATLLIIWGLMLGIIGIYSGIRPITAYAANRFVYLSFFTVDDEEISVLRKKIRENTEYTFVDPNTYRYLPYEDEDGNKVYDERYYEIRGIYWEDTDENGNIKQYKAGETVKFKAGSHMIRVKSDNPVLTGENLLDTSRSERVYLTFYTAGGSEIESLSAAISEKDEYTFPDPDIYCHSAGGESGEVYEEDIDPDCKGIYWGCTDENEKRYLFRSGEKCKFKRGIYEFYVKTDEPVTVSFRYPIDYDTYFVTEKASPGEIYDTYEKRVGDTITLKKSLGAIIWESTFKGWQEMNFDYDDDKIYAGGSSYRIMDNMDLAFYAVYDYDENWDIDAIDENQSAEDSDQSGQDTDDVIVNVDDINSAGGIGYGAYIDSSGVLRRIGGGGINGSIKSQPWLSSLTSADADPDDPASYLLDKYGRPIEESTLEQEIQNVLRQDDSALFMDVYGNSFIYYSQLSRKNNMLLAVERLTAGKTDSWVRNIQGWDAEAVNRFEAIEFALLKNEYPKEGEELVPGLFWKKEFMSELAYNKLKDYKKIWRGWLDSYDDGLLEKYEAEDNSTIIEQASPLNVFGGITAYASEKNSVGEANQIGSRINASTDLEGYTFTPQYYNENVYSSHAIALSALGLSSTQISNLQKIYSQLTASGFSDAVAAGILSNVYQESGFDPKCANGTGTTAGLFQWTSSRLSSLKTLATSSKKNWTDIDVQIKFFLQEYTGYRVGLDSYCLTYFGCKFEALSDPKKAAEAFCVKYEGCEWAPEKGWGTSPNLNEENCCKAANGIRYQLLTDRIALASTIYKSLSGGSINAMGKFANMTKAEIRSALELPNSASGIAADYKKKCTSVKLSDGHTVTVHAAVASDLREICDTMIADGFSFSNGISGWSDRGASNSFHNFGLAVDINVQDNPCIYWNIASAREATIDEVKKAGQNTGQYRVGGGPENYKPGNSLSLTQFENNVFRSYGWAWALDYQPIKGIQKLDYMHFSIGEVSTPGLNAGVFY